MKSLWALGLKCLHQSCGSPFIILVRLNPASGRGNGSVGDTQKLQRALSPGPACTSCPLPPPTHLGCSGPQATSSPAESHGGGGTLTAAFPLLQEASEMEWHLLTANPSKQINLGCICCRLNTWKSHFINIFSTIVSPYGRAPALF